MQPEFARAIEEQHIRSLKDKVRAVFAEEMPSSIRELALENIVDQAYYTGQMDATTRILDGMVSRLEKKHDS